MSDIPECPWNVIEPGVKTRTPGSLCVRSVMAAHRIAGVVSDRWSDLGSEGWWAAMRRPTVSQRFKCIFAGSHVREAVDPVVNELFKAYKVKPNWGDMRRTWKLKHCAEVNPHGSEDCPFTEAECAAAFMDAVEETLRAKPKRFGALFRYIANRTGGERADAAQRSRHRRRSAGSDGQGPGAQVRQPLRTVRDRPPGGREGGDRHVAGGGEEPVRGSDAGPTRIGSLFGTLDFGPREKPADDGEEGTER